MSHRTFRDDEPYLEGLVSAADWFQNRSMLRAYVDQGPGHLEGLTPFECYLVENVDAVADQTSGDVESPTGWFALCGRYVLSTDSAGFWYADRHATRTAAAAAFATMEGAFADWDDEPDDEPAPWDTPLPRTWLDDLRESETFYADPDLFGNDGTC